MAIYVVTASGDLEVIDTPNLDGYAALSIGAVYRACSFIAGTFACVPKSVVNRKTGADVEHPLDEVLTYRFNPWTPATVGYSTQFLHMLTDGNGYAKIRKDVDTQLINLDPSLIQMRIDRATGEPYFKYGNELISHSELMHVRTLSGDAYTGYSLVDLARRTIEAAIYAEELARRLMRDGHHMLGVLHTEAAVSTDQRATAKKTFDQTTKGIEKAGNVPIIPPGFKFTPINQSNVDSQMLQTRQFLIEEISRYWGVPQHILSKLDNATYNNVSQLGAEVVRYVLRFYVEQWEEEATYKLLTPAERAAGLVIRCDLSDLERGNWEAAVTAANALVVSGVLTDNEGRELVGYKSIEGGDIRRDPSFALREKAEAEAKAKGKAPETPGVSKSSGADAKAAEPQEGDKEPTDDFSGSGGDATPTPAPIDYAAALEPILAAAVDRVQTKTDNAFARSRREQGERNKSGEGLTVWANIFAGEQAAYVRSSLEPINQSLINFGLSPLPVETIANRYDLAIKRAAAGGDSADLQAIINGTKGVADGN